MIELRCPGCGHYLGESAAELILVDRVAKGDEVRVSPPRDIRVCRHCGTKAVYVPRSELEVRLAERSA